MPIIRRLSKLQWILVLVSSIFLLIAIGIFQSAVYRITIEPAENSNGPVKVVFYGHRYDAYLASGALHIPATGWHVVTLSDSTTLTAEEHASPLVLHSEGGLLEVGLLHYADAGVARLIDGNNDVKLIPLRSASESVSSLTVGGGTSDVIPSNSTIKNVSWSLAWVLGIILVLFFIISRIQMKKSTDTEVAL